MILGLQAIIFLRINSNWDHQAHKGYKMVKKQDLYIRELEDYLVLKKVYKRCE
jgi:hypothetical protein